jgi:hypothetical protein
MINKIYPLFFLAGLLILLSSGSVFAQKDDYHQTIRGRVVDKITNSPLPGATVVIVDSDPLIGTSTDIDGYFRLENISLGRISIHVSFIGFQTAILPNLEVISGKELVLNIELEENVFTTDVVVIRAETDKDKPLNKMASVSARSFSVEEANRFAGSYGDPSRMAANFAGVFSVDDSRNDIVIRGNSPMGLLWRLDGVSIPNPNHFGALGTTGGPISILNSNLLTNSDFFTGAFPAEYGNALSGVFDLQMRNGNNEKHEFTGQIGFNGFEVGMEGPISKKHRASYLASYRYSTLRVFDALGIDFVAGSSIPDYQDLSFKIDLPTKKWGRFSLFGIGGKSKIRLYDSEKEDDEFSYGMIGTDTDFLSNMGAIGLSNVYFFNEDTRLTTNLSLQGAQSVTAVDSIRQQEPLEKFDFYRSDYKEVIYSVSANLSHKFNTKNNIQAGIIFDLYDVKYVDSVFDEHIFKVRTNASGLLGIFQTYFQWQHRFSDQLILNSGLHFQGFSLNDSRALEPRIGMSWQFRPQQSLNFGYGLMSQTQPKMNYFTRSKLPDGSFIESNRDMGFSKSHQWVLGYEYFFAGPLRFKTETYYQYLFRIPVKESFPEFSMLNEGDYFAISLQDSLLNQGSGYNYGLELTFERFLSKGYYFLVTMSLFQSKYRGYDEMVRNTAYNGNFVLNALGGYEIKMGRHNSLAFDLRTVFAGGKRYTPIDIEKSIEKGTTEYDWSRAYELQYDPYFTLDIKISFKMNMKRLYQEWALDIKNVLDHKNIFQQLYNPLTGEIKTDYQQGLFPVIFYKVRF